VTEDDLRAALAANPRAQLEQDAITLEGTIESLPSSTGLVKVRLDGGTLVARHVNRLTPLDMNAAKILYSYSEYSAHKRQ